MLSKRAEKVVSDAVEKGGKLLWDLYGEDEDAINREAKRVYTELFNEMVCAYGNPYQIEQCILYSMGTGYQDAKGNAS